MSKFFVIFDDDNDDIILSTDNKNSNYNLPREIFNILFNITKLKTHIYIMNNIDKNIIIKYLFKK